jgi:hypothetical protein
MGKRKTKGLGVGKTIMGGSGQRPDFSKLLSQNMPRMMENIQKLLDDQSLPDLEIEETESWLDWGINLAREWGPTVLEMVPQFLALL